ncbi:MAG: hypothetical protein HPY70_10870 [Firmicutes bacterium]|nr:hypothetical protein [Bacillota bacterium]
MKKIKNLTLLIMLITVFTITSCTPEKTEMEGSVPLHEGKTAETERLLYREELLLGFVMREMMSPYGGIYTNYDKDGVFEYGVRGWEVLSESVGLMMYYAVIRENKEVFDAQYRFLTERMMTKEGFIPWKVNEDGTPTSSSSAAIDDIRIAYSLIKAHQLWKDSRYLQTAKKIAYNLAKYGVYKNYLVDFYDWEFRTKGSSVKLSYIDIAGLKALASYQPGLLRVADTGLDLLRKSLYSPQYPFRRILYDIEKKTFKNESAVNMIDTLYVSIHLSEAGIKQRKMLDWMRKEIGERGKIYGRYHPSKGEPAVNFESAAVYALGVQLSIKEGDRELADILMERLLTLQDTRENAPTYGGFVDPFEGEGHSFDNLQALIAMALLHNREGKR